MGSKEEDVPKEPVEKTVFVEDMNESELATAVSLIFFKFTMIPFALMAIFQGYIFNMFFVIKIIH